MNAAWRRFLAPGLILTSALTGLVQSVAAGSPETSSTITIRVYNDAKVDHQTQLRAEKVATGIFRNAGVEIRWVDPELTSENRQESPADERALDPSQMRLRILSPDITDSLGLPTNVMGLAPGAGPDRQRVYVFYNRVEELALRQVSAHCNGTVARPATVEQILGAMIAHELGHVLLNLPSHTKTGIMRGNWDLKDLHDVAYEDLLFTPEQDEVIRAEVVRRVGQHQAVEVARLESPTLGR